MRPFLPPKRIKQEVFEKCWFRCCLDIRPFKLQEQSLKLSHFMLNLCQVIWRTRFRSRERAVTISRCPNRKFTHSTMQECEGAALFGVNDCKEFRMGVSLYTVVDRNLVRHGPRFAISMGASSQIGCPSISDPKRPITRIMLPTRAQNPLTLATIAAGRTRLTYSEDLRTTQSPKATASESLPCAKDLKASRKRWSCTQSTFIEDNEESPLVRHAFNTTCKALREYEGDSATETEGSRASTLTLRQIHTTTSPY
ncbi:hypothetical protein B0H16DRAFT_1694979 [Mycena metata]|uniref:Uncharacterized protein n=1 Tax=Mycena metata TaxID=1033252 RepID=A0AAD7IAS6_9AGAR|nr:hypothetical protein B0H16DRAFT_1694979 [Mycena metata]